MVNTELKKDITYWKKHNSNDYIVCYDVMLEVEKEFDLFADSPIAKYKDNIYTAKTLYFYSIENIKDFIKGGALKGGIFYCIVEFPMKYSKPIGTTEIQHPFGLRYLTLNVMG